MINVVKIIFVTQTYYTPTWSGATGVKILKCLPDNKVLVKAGNNTFARPLKHMYNTEKAAQISRHDWEREERKNKKNKKKKHKKRTPP